MHFRRIRHLVEFFPCSKYLVDAKFCSILYLYTARPKSEQAHTDTFFEQFFAGQAPKSHSRKVKSVNARINRIVQDYENRPLFSDDVINNVDTSKLSFMNCVHFSCFQEIIVLPSLLIHEHSYRNGSQLQISNLRLCP